jgi:hypothetical protein
MIFFLAEMFHSSLRMLPIYRYSLNYVTAVFQKKSERAKSHKWNTIFLSPLTFLLSHPYKEYSNFSLP